MFSQKKSSTIPPGSDESLYRLMNDSLRMGYQFNWEATLLQEALEIASQLPEPLPSHSQSQRFRH